MSKYQNISEPAGDGTPSLRAENDLLVTVSDAPTASITIPTFATRRELREAERAAAALAAPTIADESETARLASSAAAVGVGVERGTAAATGISSPVVAAPDVAPVVLEGESASIVTNDAATVPAPDSRRARRAAEAAAAASARKRSPRTVSSTAATPAVGAAATGRRTGPARSSGSAAGRSGAARSTAARSTSSSRASSARTSAASATTASRGSSFSRTSQRVTVVGAMLFASAMLVATSVPANAFFVDTPELTAAKKAAGAQSFVAAGAAPEASVSRDGYSVSTIVVNEYASTSSSTFTNDVAGTVQWPFQTGVPISSGFGARQVSNCSFCSTFHQGLDFIPGAGSPIQAIADGTVSAVTGPSGAFGNHVEIEHVVDGQKVTSTYSHMQSGSVEVSVGDTVTVGQIIGAVGSTGNSTGAHLHFEIHLNGVPVDPYPWLTANTN
ncbi:M23 family metallopeptidase [Frigoribacterium sp. CFBP9039]|uniref:M23 family metallopeptidase n=1 Tax=Frigoribacterium sp. CFBP9029 TaxID=3096541 RepID=UPI002A699D3B|nr:M23 family metallopeptidase [Frigoribacterium sp. CFBP9039]MDY0946131.1 M23 family metallopeptidase [Frigoribacterium sp. CFBP9039]